MPVAAADDVLNAKGEQFLQKHWFQCHGEDFKYPGLDVSDRVTLLTPADSSEEPFLVPKDLDSSRL